MITTSHAPLVSTIGERCRLCYTCVRECPSHAIRINAGQADVLAERCIGCGNCVRVCSQKAKRVRDDVPKVLGLLDSGTKVAAMVAPSYPAEFGDIDHSYLVGMLRAAGFHLVTLVAFGADLVAERYRRLADEHPEDRRIATTCPALCFYVEKYHPDLVPFLTPVVSPMVAMARALARQHEGELKCVFIGPCIAKKREAEDPLLAGEVAAVLTFEELRRLFRMRGIKPESAVPSRFDPPSPGLGTLFPLSRGMLQAADLREDLMAGDVVVADGRRNFVEALKEFEAGTLDARLLEALCCSGCIMGPGMTCDAPLFRRRAQVSQSARRHLASVNLTRWSLSLRQLEGMNLSRDFAREDQRISDPSDDELAAILSRMGKTTAEHELNCGACGYDTCREHAVAIHRGLAESEMCLPETIERLRSAVHALNESHQQLTTTQQALMKAERLASMGQLAAGIAHEVNNPLGVVLLYAHMLKEQVEPDSPLAADVQTIVEEADRCKGIVSGLLNFARRNRVFPRRVDLAALVDRCLAILPVPEGVAVAVEHAEQPLMCDLDPDQIVQVLTNLVNNAVDAMPDGGRITVVTAGRGDEAALAVRDTGTGIPKEHQKRIFEPFFTTKQIGKGTGLGLAVTYGIVKMHRGRIEVETRTDPAAGPTGTTFTILLPRRRQEEESGEAMA